MEPLVDVVLAKRLPEWNARELELARAEQRGRKAACSRAAEARGGRPTKLTPEVRARAAALRTEGKTLSAIALELGISADTVRKAVRQGGGR
jgi:DNA-binding NarL/FixJ family response regulator